MQWTLPSVRCLVAVLVLGLLAGTLPHAPRAQMMSDRGPSVDQLIRALPDTLSGYTRTRARRWESLSSAHALFERASASGPATIDVRLVYGRKMQAKAAALFRKNGADTTATADGRTVYTVSGSLIDEKSANLLWTHDTYTLWMSAKGSSETPLDPAAAHDALRSIFAKRISADRLPDVKTAQFPKPSLRPATGFEAPGDFSTLTGQYSGGMGKAARISIAYPSDWTALDASKVNAFAKVLDISRKKAAAKKRWYGPSGSEGDLVHLYAPDEVHVQVAGPGMVTNFVGRIDPMDGIKPKEVRSRLKNATVVQSPTQTTVGGKQAAMMEVTGTSADGHEVRHRVVCIASNGAVPCVTVTRPANRTVVSADTIQTMLESVTAEVIENPN